MPVVLVAGLAGAAAAQVPPGTTVKVESAGYLSFVLTLVVLGTLGCLVSVSRTASITGVTTRLVQFAPVAGVQLGSPPPVTVAVLLTVTAPVPAPPAAAATFTGTVMMIGFVAPLAIEQPAKLEAPAALAVVQLPTVNVPPVTLIPALVVIPVGKTSASVIAAVVGPLTTPIVIRYIWPLPPTTKVLGIEVFVTVKAGGSV